MTQAHGQRKTIDIGAVFEALEQPLGLVDNPERRGETQRYIEMTRIHLERAIFDVVSSAVEAVNDAEGNIEARLEYQDGGLTLVVDPVSSEDDEGETEQLFSVDGDVEKVTIRLPAELKDLVGEAANLRGVSVNTWYIKELAAAVRNAAARAGQEAIQDATRQARESGRGRRRGGGDHSGGHHSGGGSLRGMVGDD